MVSVHQTIGSPADPGFRKFAFFKKSQQHNHIIMSINQHAEKNPNIRFHDLMESNCCGFTKGWCAALMPHTEKQ